MLNGKSKNIAKAEPIINGCMSTPSVVQTELIHIPHMTIYRTGLAGTLQL